MPFPQSWADNIVGRLSLRYGAAFDHLYTGRDMAMVQADWANALDGMERFPAAIKWALDNLPERAPHASAFRAHVLKAPGIDSLPAPNLALPGPPADPQRVERLMAEARAAVAADSRSPAQSIIDSLLARSHVGRPQREFLATCVKSLPANDQRREAVERLLSSPAAVKEAA